MTRSRSRYPIDRLDDPRLQPILALRNRSERDRRRRFYVEGVRFVLRAAQHGRFCSLIIAPSLLSHALCRSLAQRERTAGRETLEITPEVLRALGFGADPQSIGAVVRQQWSELPATGRPAMRLLVALSRVRAPGNLGTIIRTCEAAGAGLVLLGDDVDPFDPRAVRGSMGSIFSPPIVRADLSRLLTWTRSRGGTIVGASPGGSCDFRELAPMPPVVLLMSEERKGLTAPRTRRAFSPTSWRSVAEVGFALRTQLNGR